MELGDRSRKNLEGVHPDLVRVVKRAAQITDLEFIVTEGMRTVERQRELYEAGATRTMRSRHIPDSNECELACAVDLAVVVGNEVRWDWPLYRRLSITMKRAAEDVGVPITWGGDWRTFKDGPHYELPWSYYP